MPLAGDSWTVSSDGGASEPRQTARVLANVVKDNPSLNFKILAGVGSDDGTRGSMSPQIHAMWALSQFNLQYHLAPGGNHDAPTMDHLIEYYANQLF